MFKDPFAGLFKYVDSLGFKQTPDYELCIKKIVQALGDDQNIDWKMDWSFDGLKWDQTYLSKAHIFKQVLTKQPQKKEDLNRNSIQEGEKEIKEEQNIDNCSKYFSAQVNSNEKEVLNHNGMAPIHEIKQNSILIKPKFKQKAEFSELDILHLKKLSQIIQIELGIDDSEFLEEDIDEDSQAFESQIQTLFEYAKLNQQINANDIRKISN
ncbi:UNKNOWN [Stylonychia lemnae]|uniref:Uncharacterized protein n=1 Tax=Stylonychia lemnae TaxID=5949 RepID=A0A078AUK2_STYLE|nr:UNKNOWN [Stylonychia lemnae]|eukprot:CDW84558.1 UNKNOWN [Stylonychia lemnae]